MITNNIGFYVEISKSMSQLSSNIIKYALSRFFCLSQLSGVIEITYFYRQSIEIWTVYIIMDLQVCKFTDF